MNKVIQFLKKNAIIVIVVVIIGVILLKKKELFTTTDEIKIYGTDWCGYTTRQKEYFDNKKKSYEYINWDEEKKKCTDLGIKAYPVTFIGTTRYDGYNDDI